MLALTLTEQLRVDVGFRFSHTCLGVELQGHVPTPWPADFTSLCVQESAHQQLLSLPSMLDVAVGERLCFLAREVHGCWARGASAPAGDPGSTSAHGTCVPRALDPVICHLPPSASPVHMGLSPQVPLVHAPWHSSCLGPLPVEASLSPSIVFSIRASMWGALNDGDAEAS